MKLLIEKDIKPSDIVTKKSLENALRLITVLGGSTNAVLHFLAISRAANLDLTIDYFQEISDSTPFLANLKPSGKYLMEDLHNIGGVPGVMKYMLDNNNVCPLQSYKTECGINIGKWISKQRHYKKKNK